jgi:hypothetical protein
VSSLSKKGFAKLGDGTGRLEAPQLIFHIVLGLLYFHFLYGAFGESKRKLFNPEYFNAYCKWVQF